MVRPRLSGARRRAERLERFPGAKFASMVLSLALGAALGLSLALVAFAITPRQAMRRSRAVFVENRRDTIFWAGLAAALGIGLGVAIAWGL